MNVSNIYGATLMINFEHAHFISIGFWFAIGIITAVTVYTVFYKSVEYLLNKTVFKYKGKK